MNQIEMIFDIVGENHSTISRDNSDSDEFGGVINESQDNLYHTKEDESQSKQPFIDKVDKKIAIIMIVIGTGYLFPFESFLMSLDYFSMLYPDKKIYSTFPFVYMGAIMLTFLVFMRIPNVASHSKRMIVGFSFYILMMILIPLINITSIGGSSTSYIVTLIVFALTGIADGFVQGTVYSIAGMFGPKYTQFTQIGVGLAGIIVIVTRIISKVAFPFTEEGLRHGCLLYFLISAFIILLALLAFLHLMKEPSISQYLSEKNTKKDKDANDDSSALSNMAPKKEAYRYVFRENLQLGLINMMIFVISGSTFPGLIFELKSSSIRYDWFIIIVTAVHNVFDFIGKSLPFYIHPDGKNNPSKLVLWILTLGRSIFIVLFFLAMYGIAFTHDSWIIIFISIFGFTNGYICSVVMAEGPRIVTREYKGLSGLFMTTCLILGITIGNSLNFMAVQIIDTHKMN